jgi:hypothetical protein
MTKMSVIDEIIKEIEDNDQDILESLKVDIILSYIDNTTKSTHILTLNDFQRLIILIKYLKNVNNDGKYNSLLTNYLLFIDTNKDNIPAELSLLITDILISNSKDLLNQIYLNYSKDISFNNENSKLFIDNYKSLLLTINFFYNRLIFTILYLHSKLLFNITKECCEIMAYFRGFLTYCDHKR